MPIYWTSQELQPLRHTALAEKLVGKWEVLGCHVEAPTQVSCTLMAGTQVSQAMQLSLVLSQACYTSACDAESVLLSRQHTHQLPNVMPTVHSAPAMSSIRHLHTAQHLGTCSAVTGKQCVYIGGGAIQDCCVAFHGEP